MPAAQSTSAIAADDVVMVVADPGLVAGHRARWLDPPQQAGLGQRPQHVVDGLGRHLAEVLAGGVDDRVRVGVRMRVHGVEDRQPRLGDPEVGPAQQAL